jgi:hypothetical protein
MTTRSLELSAPFPAEAPASPLATIFFVMGALHLYGAIHANIRRIKRFLLIAGYCLQAVTVVTLTATVVEVIAH